MIHINGSSKSSPPLSSTMCSRRHKGMLQTSIILVLIVCIGYGFYLYNVLQVKIKYLDMKSLRHQSQQASLSSQLQAAYEDRARLEKAIQKSKTDMQKVQEEKESMIQEMLIEHQDKNQALKKSYEDLKEKHKDLTAENQNLKTKHDRVYKEHESLKKKHQEAMSDHAAKINEVHVELQRYENENQAILQVKQELEQQVEEAKEKYMGLKNVLKAVPEDAVNFDHPDVANLDTNAKNALKEHLGESRGLGHWGQPRNPDKEQDDAAQRRETEEKKQLEYLEERQRQQRETENGRQDQLVQGNIEGHETPPPLVDNQDNVLDICSLRPDPGPCSGPGQIRYAYNPGVKDCRGFMYGGCGGNQNNFPSVELCVDVCNDPDRRYVHQSLTEEQQVRELQKQGVLDGPDEVDTDEDQPDLNIHKVVGQPVEDLGRDEGRSQDEREGEEDEEEERRRLTQEEEERAREQEEAAKRELEDQGGQLDAKTYDQDPLEKLKENSKLQLEVAQHQQADMERLLGQQQKDQQPQPVNQIEAKIEDEDGGGNEEEYNNRERGDNNEEEEGENEDEEGANEEEEDEGDDGAENEEPADEDEPVHNEDDDVQVAMPPAAQVAGHDPEAVMNAPPANQDGIDSKEINGQDIYAGEEEDDDDPQDGDNALEYQDDNQQEKGDAGVEDNPAREEEEGEEYDRNDAKSNRDNGFEDKVDDDGGEVDDYENEEEDEAEKEARMQREHAREIRDRAFEREKDVQDMIPLDAKHKREM